VDFDALNELPHLDPVRFLNGVGVQYNYLDVLELLVGNNQPTDFQLVRRPSRGV
jgi:hypothetical protein